MEICQTAYCVARVQMGWYSSPKMSADGSVKALLVVLTDDASAAAYVINRLKPESLCFFLPESAKPLVESSVQPKIVAMPRRWDWIVTPDAGHFMVSYQTLARALSDMLRAWEVHPGELVLDVTGATPAMASAAVLAGMPFSSKVVTLTAGCSDPPEGSEGVDIGGVARLWRQGNPWDEASAISRREASEMFNRGAYGAAAFIFQRLEVRVSGGQKPLYHALADMADGYALWNRFQYRLAWEKLKAAHKALEMAAVWGGPPGLPSLLPVIKHNAGFLEKLVLDPHEVKEAVALDLLAHARRKATCSHDGESAMAVLLRALEAFAQVQLFRHYKIKTWDVRPEQLPPEYQDTCRTCYQDDIAGKYKLPLQAQFRVLAGLGHDMGHTYVKQWTNMKPLLDAAGHAVLGHGFDTIKAERFHQLHEIVVKLTGVNDLSLPKFPVLNL